MQTIIQKALDGALDDQEKQAWQADLQQHPEMAAVYQEQVEMSRMLEQVALTDPSPRLVQKIMHAVQLKKTAPATWRQRLNFDRFLQPRFKYVYSFAGGLAVGLAVLVMFMNNAFDASRDSNAVSGTIYTSMQNNETEIIDLDQIKGRIDWSRSSNKINVSFSLNQMAPFFIQFLYPRDSYSLSSYHLGMNARVQELTAISDKTTVHLYAPGQVAFNFSSADANMIPFTVRFVRGNRVLFAKTIQ